MNALDAARIGLHSMEHFYGLFEALLKDRSVQPSPSTQLPGRAAPLRPGRAAVEPDPPAGSERWNALSSTSSSSSASSSTRR
jgi:hypothetical protein